MSERPKVIIPFRLRDGGDLSRTVNLDVVLGWWYMWGFEPKVQSDGLSGDKPFNRHRAFNLAVEKDPDTNVFIFAEADMLIHPSQVTDAVQQASESPGLVVPFREYRSLSQQSTQLVHNAYYDETPATLVEWWGLHPIDPRSIFAMHPETMLADGENVGSAFVVSRETLRRAGGFPEVVDGPWYDAKIAEQGFRVTSGRPTRWVTGPAVHLHHPEDPSTGASKYVWRYLKQSSVADRNRNLRKIMRTRISSGTPERNA